MVDLNHLLTPKRGGGFCSRQKTLDDALRWLAQHVGGLAHANGSWTEQLSRDSDAATATALAYRDLWQRLVAAGANPQAPGELDETAQSLIDRTRMAPVWTAATRQEQGLPRLPSRPTVMRRVRT